MDRAGTMLFSFAKALIDVISGDFLNEIMLGQANYFF